MKKLIPSVDPRSGGIALAHVGNLYMKRGQYDESLSWFLEATKILETIETPEAMNWLAESWRGIAVYYSENAKFDKALEALDKSEKLFTKTNNKVGLAGVMNEYGVLFDFLQNKTRAEQVYLEAIKLLENSDDTESKMRIAFIKVNLGLLQTTSLGEYDKALKNFDESEPLFLKEGGYETQLAMLYANKALALRRLGRFEEGLGFAKKSLDLFLNIFKNKPDPYLISLGYTEYANALLDLQRYSDSLKWADEAINRSNPIKEIKWRALTAKGQALVGLKRFPEAKVEFDKAISIVEDLMDEAFGDEEARAGYFGGFIYPYHYMANMLMQQGDYESALLYAERSKAKGILSSLQGPRNDWSQGMTAVQKQEELELIKKLVSVNTELSQEEKTSKKDELLKKREEFRRELETFRFRLYKSNPELILRRANLSTANLTKLNTVLPNNKTIGLHYIVTPEKVSLLIITKLSNGKINVIGKLLPITGTELTERVNKFRSYLENDALGGFNTDARYLYDKLLKPAETYLKGKETVVIVPDDVLWDLPFQALLDQQQKYFIENYAVFYTPSFFALSQIKTTKNSRTTNYKRSLLAFGNPDLGKGNKTLEIAKKMGEDLVPIPQAEKLVNELCKKFSSCVDSTFVGANATESEVKQKSSGARIIHLAAHGILDNTSPLYSHVVLSQTGNNGQEDGLLEAFEIMNLDFQSTEMVVLSACETARGEFRYGEGIIGLTWATFIAGSPTTVASQWGVDADSTNLLMKNFYDNLFSDNTVKLGMNRPMAMTKAKAMQKAMISLIKSKEYNHPSFWAGFVVVGDGQ